MKKKIKKKKKVSFYAERTRLVESWKLESAKNINDIRRSEEKAEAN